jgi:invasion protein IalB
MQIAIIILAAALGLFVQTAYAEDDGQEKPPLLYSPWTKNCIKQDCFVSRYVRLESGKSYAAIMLILPEGHSGIVRITVPLGMRITQGTRLTIDHGQPAQQPFQGCFEVGCMSDYPVTDDMIAKMKNGQTITMQATNMQGQIISQPIPLADFGKVYDGPATKP